MKRIYRSSSENEYREFSVFRIQGRRSIESRTDAVVIEEPLEIRLNGESAAVTMRTPGDDEALAAGFLQSEGIIRSREDIWDIKRCADPRNPDSLNIVDVVIPESLLGESRENGGAGPQIQSGRQRYASSACGVCGRASIEEVRKIAAPFEFLPDVDPKMIRSLPGQLRASQSLFEMTGGLHAAGLFDLSGRLHFSAEDVGRHNAVDKALGKALLADTHHAGSRTEIRILLVSGRASFEIVQKALVARIPIVCSVSAPSSLAVELARESGMMLIGFLRDVSMNVYAGMDNVRE